MVVTVFHVIHGEIEIMVSQVLNPLRIHFKAVHSAGNSTEQMLM